MSANVGPFVIDVETGWSSPTKRAQRFAYLRAAMEFVAALTGTRPSATDAPIGEPRWRVVLRDGDVLLAGSRWRDDRASVEHLRDDWRRRVEALSAPQVRSTAHRWAGE